MRINIDAKECCEDRERVLTLAHDFTLYAVKKNRVILMAPDASKIKICRDGNTCRVTRIKNDTETVFHVNAATLNDLGNKMRTTPKSRTSWRYLVDLFRRSTR